VHAVLWIHNKVDLLPEVPTDDAEVVHVSAARGIGLRPLHMRLRALATGHAAEGAEGEFSARARHVEALQRAAQHAEGAGAHLRHEHLELAAEELRLAHDALGEITGRISADDLLGHVFSTFCIGK
jgi:tRNA modification GTPase